MTLMIVRRFQEFKQRLIFTGDFQDTFSHSDCSIRLIDHVSNLVYWSRFVNKLDPWHYIYIMQQ